MTDCGEMQIRGPATHKETYDLVVTGIEIPEEGSAIWLGQAYP